MGTIAQNITPLDKVLRDLAAAQPLRLQISGNCMHPLIKDGASVEISSKRFYWPGDVLVFRRQDGQVLVHRLTGFYPSRNGLRYLTKADAALSPDSPVGKQGIIGKISGGDVASVVQNVPLAHRLRSLCFFIRFAVLRLLQGRLKNVFWRPVSD